MLRTKDIVCTQVEGGTEHLWYRQGAFSHNESIITNLFPPSPQDASCNGTITVENLEQSHEGKNGCSEGNNLRIIVEHVCPCVSENKEHGSDLAKKALNY